MRIERRQFLGQAAVLSGTVQRTRGAGDRVRVGLIGCGGRGLYVANYMRQAPGVEFAAVCDVYQPHAERAREWAGGDAGAYRDFRQLLDRKDIDAVLIATPDHWHAIPAVLACQAGKDVYVEKPLAHNVREGRAIVEAARRYNRVVQAGTQHRSAPHFAEIAGIVQSGALGEVRFVRVWNYTNMWPNGIGREPDSPVPEGLDWDFYLGPAPKVPFNRKRFLGTFRWFRDYAGGYITDYGTHRFATVHQVMGADAPRTVSAAGGRFSIHDAGDVPDVLQVSYEYAGFVMSYEACMMNAHGVGGRTPEMKYYHAVGPDDRPHGMAFYGTSGTIFADRIGYDIYPEPKNGRLERRHMNTTDATALHTANFIDCVRSRKAPAAEAETGHRATTIGHLGNISYWTGKKLHWDAAREDFNGEPEASRLLSRQARKPWNLLTG
ncbi:MAG: Gfo/Idh/MocA family oxidoreductase [Acidobacteria bacterium]|nr:Gfo/Idh/MocA family oxidoreductase [Acidobacteriota bacterium]